MGLLRRVYAHNASHRVSILGEVMRPFTFRAFHKRLGACISTVPYCSVLNEIYGRRGVKGEGEGRTNLLLASVI